MLQTQGLALVFEFHHCFKMRYEEKNYFFTVKSTDAVLPKAMDPIETTDGSGTLIAGTFVLLLHGQ